VSQGRGKTEPRPKKSKEGKERTLNISEVLLDLSLEGSLRELGVGRGSGSHVLPEEGVVDVSYEREEERRTQRSVSFTEQGDGR